MANDYNSTEAREKKEISTYDPSDGYTGTHELYKDKSGMCNPKGDVGEKLARIKGEKS